MRAKRRICNLPNYQITQLPNFQKGSFPTPKNRKNYNNQTTGFEHWSTEAIKARKRELEAWLLEHYPMPTTETDEDAHIERVLQQHKHLFTSATPAHHTAPANHDNGERTVSAGARELSRGQSGLPRSPLINDGNELIQEVTQFIARYLQCSEHQRTLLALWVLHTYCFCAARVTPYLAIRSADKQSGKTLCLQLLSLLCKHAAFTSGGFTARDLALPMKEKPIDALLFDECQLTIGTRPRPRSPALRAALAGSFHLGLGHRNIAEERNAFLPKAFASQAPLPEELADRCIPIILEPLQTAPSTSSSPSISSTEIPERFDLHHVADQIKPLRERLDRWAKNHFNLLTNRTLLPRSAFPPNLSPRQQDLCDPLLQIAALVGGPWVARALQACAIVFDLQSIFELRPNLQLLADVRDCFAHHNWPDRLPTEALQDWTDSLSPRPWDADGPLNPRQIAHLLRPFHIHPRELRMQDNKFRRGYELKDFQEPWQKYFPHSTIVNKDAPCDTISPAASSQAQQRARRGESAVADDTISPARAICSEPRSAGSTVADNPPHVANPSRAGTQRGEVERKLKNRLVIPRVYPRDSGGKSEGPCGSPQTPSRPVPARRGSKIPNKNKGCDTISAVDEVRRRSVADDTKKSAAPTDEAPPSGVTAPVQQSRPDEILPGITCGDVFDDRWLRAFRR